MWFLFALVLLAAGAFLGLKLYQIETAQPFQNQQSSSGVPGPRVATAPAPAASVSKPAIPARTEAKRYSGYEKLLTSGEAALFKALSRALPSDHYLFAKVRMADLLEPIAESPIARRTALEEISAQRLDFVICRGDSWEILGVVELVRAGDQAGEDGGQLEQVFRQTAFPLIRVPAREAYEAEEISRLVQRFHGATPLPAAPVLDARMAVSTGKGWERPPVTTVLAAA